MNNIYDFVAGPLAWASLLVFIGGLVGKFFYLLYLMRTKEPAMGAYMSPKYGMRSLIVWSIPFFTRSMRLNPVLTGVSFVFHLCLLISPLFLVAHMIMLEEAIGISWWTISDHVADVMTVLVILAIIYFAWRRSTDPVAKYLTTYKEYLILALVAAPFVTGFLAYHQIFDYMTMLILHILSAELLLVLIPFTWLSHMLLGPMARFYMGSEFGGVRHTKDW